jgi:hypothetical protein
LVKGRVARWYIFKQKIQIWFILEGKGWKMLVYFTAIWYILWPFGNVAEIWYIFPRFGILCQEKSGNPGPGSLDSKSL